MSDHRPRDGTTPATLGRYEFARRVLIVAGVAGLAVALGAVVARAYDVFFLFFLAVLLAILLRAISDALARRTGLAPGWALAAVVTVLVALAAGGVYLAGSVVVNQFNELVSNLPRSVERARDYLKDREWGRQALQAVPSTQSLIDGQNQNAAAQLSAFFSTTFGVLGNLVVLVFLTLYLAASPQTYLTGLLKLVPPRRRERAAEVLGAVGFHLRWWLVGRLVAMLAVGLITGVGLWAVGVPQYLILALVTALLTAVPFVGPIVAAIPGLLLALMQGPTTALWALAVYVLAQMVENYLLTPLIQQNTVRLPPVLTIMAIVLVGALFGVLGLIVATPLAVTILVVVKMLYVEDVLGDQLDVPGAHPVAMSA